MSVVLRQKSSLMRDAMNRILLTTLICICLTTLCFEQSAGQNINVSTPFTSTSDSYYENIGVGFGFSIPGGRGPGSRVVGLSPNGQLMPNLTFSRGIGFGRPFGGFVPGAGGAFGFRQVGNNGGGFALGLNFAKGSRRSIVSTTPSLTVQNGFGGSIYSGQIRPFVTGVVPIVGSNFATPVPNFNGRIYPAPMPIDNAVTRAINSGQLSLARNRAEEQPLTESASVDYGDAESTAIHGDASVASLKAERIRRLAAQQKAIDDKIHEAEQLAEQQEFAMARTKYREALRLVKDDVIRKDILNRIAATRNR